MNYNVNLDIGKVLETKIAKEIDNYAKKINLNSPFDVPNTFNSICVGGGKDRL